MIFNDINKHFSELKNRLALLAVTWFSTLLSCYTFKEIILYNIIVTFDKFNPYFILTDVAELFNLYLHLTFFIGNQLLFVFVIYHITMFLSEGLYKKELKAIKSVTLLVLAILFKSLLIANFISIPLMNNFFFYFQSIINKTTIIPIFFEAKLKEYVNFYTSIYILTVISMAGITSLIYFISELSLNLNKIKKIRKLFYFIFLLLSTIITPPDILSQLTLTLILTTAYEFSLICINIIELLRKPIKTYQHADSKH